VTFGGSLYREPDIIRDSGLILELIAFGIQIDRSGDPTPPRLEDNWGKYEDENRCQQQEMSFGQRSKVTSEATH